MTDLKHYGVKGMRWGVRKAQGRVSVETTRGITGKTKVKTKGGEELPAHKDAIKARKTTQKLKKSGVNSLSNDDLRELQNRLNLEQNVKRLQVESSPGPKKFVAKLLVNTGSQQATRVANIEASRKVDDMLSRRGR